ncbi:hypothetical protein CANCADRAFT_137008 [Tortispora caseinolytica NRRL Y-17796]|uniref:Kinetochore protein Spc24 n=1 Tax=Tortispora caseinolytica NRRL Y-17796 TaxID=767744 RepID=A0A1E4TC38_9ASCO|nr:hypothetical protein CANCADRAFT_137008 [Tortispora caseinolytica NRRL Y-17796]
MSKVTQFSASELSSYRSSMSELTEVLPGVTENTVQKLQQIQATLNDNQAKRANELKEKQAKLQILEEQLSAAKNNMITLQKNLTSHEPYLNELNRQKDDVNNKISHMNTTRDSLSNEIDSMSKECAKLEKVLQNGDFASTASDTESNAKIVQLYRQLGLQIKTDSNGNPDKVLAQSIADNELSVIKASEDGWNADNVNSAWNAL